jgi:hypothetical protein
MGRIAGRFDHILNQPPEPAGPVVEQFILIDTTNCRALARHEDLMTLAALHYIQFANTDGAIVRCGQNRVYAQFTADQLGLLALNAGVTGVTAQSYSELIATVRTHLEAVPWLQFPFTKEEVLRQAYAIQPSDARPMAFAPGADRPELLRAWHAEPQANRKREDSSFWIYFSSGFSADVPLPEVSGTATIRKRNPPRAEPEEQSMSTKKAPAKKATKKAATKKAAAKKSAPAKKATKSAGKASGAEERNGVKRPKPGGNTGNVWAITESLMEKKGSCPTFKEVDAAIEKKFPGIPTATRRANYAVCRKFHGITGRVSE